MSNVVRGCPIGEGRPVILPIVERAEAAVLEKAAQFSTLQADCVEWRVTILKVPVPRCCPLSGKDAGRPEGQAAARHHPHEGRGRRTRTASHGIHRSLLHDP